MLSLPKSMPRRTVLGGSLESTASWQIPLRVGSTTGSSKTGTDLATCEMPEIDANLTGV